MYVLFVFGVSFANLHAVSVLMFVSLAWADGVHYGADNERGRLFKASMLVINKTFTVSIGHFTLQLASVDVSVAHCLNYNLWTHRISILAYVIEFFRTILILGPAD